MPIEDLILPHTFIHADLSAHGTSQLKKFSIQEIFTFAISWLNEPSICPYYSDAKGEDLAKKLGQIVDSKQSRIQFLVNSIWSRGLNLYQVADIDTQLISREKVLTTWTHFTFHLGSGELFVPVLEPAMLVKGLERAMYPMILGHIFVTSTSDMGMIFIRFQTFNPRPKKSGPLVPHRPLYIALPASSPHVFMSSNDPSLLRSARLALRTVVTTPGRPVVLSTNSEIPFRSLNSFAVLKGASRHASALGKWADYAKGRYDASPLAASHTAVNEQKATNEPPKVAAPSSVPLSQNPDFLKAISVSGNKLMDTLNSDATPSPSERQRIANIKFYGHASLNPGDAETHIPVSVFQAKINEPVENSSRAPLVTIEFEGSDVFGGLHELAVNEANIVDVNRIPSWLTGENSNTTSGKVRNGNFEPL
ncbi:hypothetical protein TRVA0_029S01354 [Trichomonascus vanleenenianus]|uniref:Chl4p n=1 Tax=Trichomonascus vanleenenianus TaxID=2268995 RepID=UPI003EC977FF